jgi:hypothetical protein
VAFREHALAVAVQGIDGEAGQLYLPAAARLDGRKAGKAQAAPAVKEEAEAPPWPAPPQEEAFHGLAGEIARTIGPHTEADPVALVLQTLVGFGKLIGRTADFVAESDSHYLNEFVVLVGLTSKGRKGSSWGRVYRLLEATAAEWARERVQSGLSSGRGSSGPCATR